MIWKQLGEWEAIISSSKRCPLMLFRQHFVSILTGFYGFYIIKFHFIIPHFPRTFGQKRKLDLKMAWEKLSFCSIIVIEKTYKSELSTIYESFSVKRKIFIQPEIFYAKKKPISTFAHIIPPHTEQQQKVTRKGQSNAVEFNATLEVRTF